MQKELFHSDHAHKDIFVVFPYLNKTITNDRIHKNSFKLKESIMDSKSFEAVGCISSCAEITIQGINFPVKGEKIQIYIGNADDRILVFSGYIDSAVLSASKRYKKIIAYDILFEKCKKDVAEWYKSLSFPMTLKKFRDLLFSYLGITQNDILLPNDGIVIDRQYNPESMNSLDLIKSICQLNGCFGIDDRQGNFTYKFIRKLNSTIYPSNFIYPSSAIYPTAESKVESAVTTERIEFYRSLTYEEYDVKNITRVTIRDDDKSAGITFGSGTNTYIIQGNVFTYGLASDTLRYIAKNVLDSIKDITYTPFSSKCNGLPYVFCGDTVGFYVVDMSKETMTFKEKSFIVFSRELSGDQALKDSYEADGEENQRIFITDLSLNYKLLEKETEKLKEEINNIDDRVSALEEGGSGGNANLLSVEELPENPDPEIWYFIIDGSVTEDIPEEITE